MDPLWIVEVSFGRLIFQVPHSCSSTRRERGLSSRLVAGRRWRLHSSQKHGIHVRAETRYEEFSKALLDEAAHSADLYSDTRRILNREIPVSSVRLYFNELVSRTEKPRVIA